MTYSLWDKKSAIYNITAEQAIKNNPLYGSENSYLFYTDTGEINDILPISTLRKITDLNDSNDDTAICEAYINILTAPALTTDDKIESINNDMKLLTESNHTLIDCIIDMIIKNDLDVPSAIKDQL